MIVSGAFTGKRYAVLGLARSGLSTVETLLASGARVTAWDNREEARMQVEAKDHPLAELADPLAIELAGFDGVVVSPGVPLNRHPIADAARAANVPLIGDIELFAQARASLPPHRVVAITGTNGKSTTTALVHHICRSAALPVRMGGNIGLPVLGQEPLPVGGVYVLELSSYQIDLTHSLAADIAVLINLSPDHLDRYNGFEGYMASKVRLFAMQEPGQHAVFGCGDSHTLAVARNCGAARGSDYVHIVDPGGLTGQADWPSLQGPHNLQNAAIAVEIARLLGLNEAQWRPALASFKGLSHRMEVVGTHDGVLFVNDSKATNATATAPALAAFPAIRWICGGQAKADHLDECAPHFSHVREAYTIGEASDLFARILAPHIKVAECGDLAHAVLRAAHDAQPGETVLLSPACASFDQFKDFEARGDAFRRLVGAL